MGRGGKSVSIDGLEELKKVLLDLPERLWKEADAIVMSEATAAYQAMDAATSEVTGNLRSRLELDTSESGPGRPAVIVRNKAKHAWLWEHGSKGPRTGKYGWGKTGTGTMPGANRYIPIAIRRREAMHDRLVAMVERHGLKVDKS